MLLENYPLSQKTFETACKKAYKKLSGISNFSLVELGDVYSYSMLFILSANNKDIKKGSGKRNSFLDKIDFSDYSPEPTKDKHISAEKKIVSYLAVSFVNHLRSCNLNNWLPSISQPVKVNKHFENMLEITPLSSVDVEVSLTEPNSLITPFSHLIIENFKKCPLLFSVVFLEMTIHDMGFEIPLAKQKTSSHKSPTLILPEILTAKVILEFEALIGDMELELQQAFSEIITDLHKGKFEAENKRTEQNTYSSKFKIVSRYSAIAFIFGDENKSYERIFFDLGLTAEDFIDYLEVLREKVIEINSDFLRLTEPSPVNYLSLKIFNS